MPADPRSALTTTRLVSVLRAAGMPGEAPSQRDVVKRFGQMIDLGYSVSLSDALRQIDRAEAPSLGAEGPPAARPMEPGEVLLEARRSAIEYVLMSFSTDQNIAMPFRFPKASAQTLSEPEKAALAYQRFYALHQSEMDFRVLRLRKEIRTLLAAKGGTLASLLALDDTLNDTLAKHAKKALSAAPRLLAHRFLVCARMFLEQNGDSATDPADWIRPGQWLADFRNETEDMLLAELDLRLHPLLGLIEAVATDEELA